MDRRTFMGVTGAAGAAALGATQAEAQASDAEGERDYYELRRYVLETDEQRAGLDSFLEDAAIPALNRIGIDQVGVFSDKRKTSPVYVLLRHKSMASVATMLHRLGADAEFMSAGASFLDAPSTSPAYTRIESSLLVAFTGMPKMNRPITSDGRVFQLRVYESPSVQTGQKKIEMFNSAEIEIFKKTGLTAVFYGEAIAGEKLPNLTYMLSFESMKAQGDAWKVFLDDPDWKELSGRPEYANDKILSGITNINLIPTAYSQL